MKLAVPAADRVPRRSALSACASRPNARERQHFAVIEMFELRAIAETRLITVFLNVDEEAGEIAVYFKSASVGSTQLVYDVSYANAGGKK